MKRKHIWEKAFSLSFAFHLIVIVIIGSIAAGFHQEIQRPQEQFITVNLADMPEETAKVQESASPLNSIKEVLQHNAMDNNSSSAGNNNMETENVSENNTDDNSEINNEGANNVSAISAADGILPGGRSGGDSKSTSTETSGGGDSSNGSFSGGSEAYGSNGGETGEESSGGGATEDRYSVASRFAQAVEANKSYPYAAVRLNQQGVVTVNVTLDSSGNLISAYVVSSAGKNLDKAALNAVYAACPFSHGLNDSINMDVPVHFYLN